MTDQYEEFKKWFKKNNYGIWKVNDFKIPLTAETVININDVFDIFEEEQAEKEKEKQVKGIIKEVFNTVPLNEYEVEDEWYRKTIYVPNDIITEIYDKLKEKDLIK